MKFSKDEVSQCINIYDPFLMIDGISEFVEKLGESLASMDSLNEGSSMCESLPTISELKQLHKDIAKLEK